MARLTHPNGTVVSVADDRAEALLARGFTAEKPKATKQAAKPAKSTSK